MGIKVSGPPHKTPKGHPRQACVTYLQETSLSPQHSHRTINRGNFFFGIITCEYSTNPEGDNKET